MEGEGSRVERALKLKEEGNAAVLEARSGKDRSNCYFRASTHYIAALSVAIGQEATSRTFPQEYEVCANSKMVSHIFTPAIIAVVVPILTNFALVCNELGHFHNAISSATAATVLDPKWIKGHLRLAVAYLRVLDVAKARVEIQAALHLQPDNADAMELLRKATTGISQMKDDDEELICPICFREMLDPWEFSDCKHVFCFECVFKWNSNCSLCRGDGSRIGPLPKRLGAPYYTRRVVTNPRLASNWYNLGAKTYPLLDSSGFPNVSFSRLQSDTVELPKSSVKDFISLFGMEVVESINTQESVPEELGLQQAMLSYLRDEVEFFRKFPEEKAKEDALVRLMSPELFRVAVVLDPTLACAWFKLGESSEFFGVKIRFPSSLSEQPDLAGRSLTPLDCFVRAVELKLSEVTAFPLWSAICRQMKTTETRSITIGGKNFTILDCIEAACKAVHPRTNEKSLAELGGLIVEALPNDAVKFTSYYKSQKWNLTEMIFQLVDHDGAAAPASVWAAAAVAWRRLSPNQRQLLTGKSITQNKLWGLAVSSSVSVSGISGIFSRMNAGETAELPNGTVKTQRELGQQSALFFNDPSSFVRQCLAAGMSIASIKLMNQRLFGASKEPKIANA